MTKSREGRSDEAGHGGDGDVDKNKVSTSLKRKLNPSVDQIRGRNLINLFDKQVPIIEEDLIKKETMGTSGSSTTSDIPSWDKSKKRRQMEARICKVCGTTWQSPSHMKRHAVVHTGDKLFPCDNGDCKYKCSRFDNLQTHKLIHTDRRMSN